MAMAATAARKQSIILPSITVPHGPSAQMSHRPSAQMSHRPSVQMSHRPSVQMSHRPSDTYAIPYDPNIAIPHHPSIAMSHHPSIAMSQHPSIAMSPQHSNKGGGRCCRGTWNWKNYCLLAIVIVVLVAFVVGGLVIYFYLFTDSCEGDLEGCNVVPGSDDQTLCGSVPLSEGFTLEGYFLALSNDDRDPPSFGRAVLYLPGSDVGHLLCPDGLRQEEYNVLCKELGYVGGALGGSAVWDPTLGSNSSIGAVGVADVTCPPGARYLCECSQPTVGVDNVQCAANRYLRLRCAPGSK